jgi:hypothetical protein
VCWGMFFVYKSEPQIKSAHDRADALAVTAKKEATRPSTPSPP